MPLTDITSDVSLEILALLPCSTLSILTSVQKTWKELVDANEHKVYHNAAALHGFILSVNTSLEDALASLDFPVATLQIRGWKQFCQIQLAVERNWTGLGPSTMSKMPEIGDNLHYRQVIAGSGLTITASFLNGIAVSDGHDTLWALPPDYLQGPTFFSYDQGYLVFPNPIPSGGIIDVWHNTSSRDFLFDPSGAQRVGAEASVFLYGEPTVGHFVPCYSLPPPEKGRIDVTKKSVKVLYPTILAATKTHIHMWDISTGEYIRALSMKGDLDAHSMGVTGFEVSQDFVVAYDPIQLRLFSRHDGNFLYHFSKRTVFIPTEPPAVQLSPPRTTMTAGQWDGAVLMQQVLFRKRRKWACPRGEFAQVGLSDCGTTLVIVFENNRVFIIHELKRMVAESLPIEDVSFELKMAKEYGDSRTMSLAVTRDRIAIGTFRGILVLTLDRSKAGPAPTGSVRLETSSAIAPLQLAAAFINFGWQSRDSNLHIEHTKLFFNAEPSTHVDRAINRQPRKASGRIARAWLNEPIPPAPENDVLSDQFDDMPDLQSVSNSSDEEEDEDEESDWSVQEGPPPESVDPSDSDDDAEFSDIGSDADDDLPALAPNQPPTQQQPQPANVSSFPAFAFGHVAYGILAAQPPPLHPQNMPPQLFTNPLMQNPNFHVPPGAAVPVLSSGFVIDTAPESEDVVE